MEDNQRNTLRLLDQPIHVQQELSSGVVQAALDVPALVVVITDVDNHKVPLRRFAALHNLREFLCPFLVGFHLKR